MSDDSVAGAIGAVAKAILALAVAVEKHPLRVKWAESLSPEEAFTRMQKLDSPPEETEMSSELEQLRACVAELEDIVRSAADGDTGPAGLEDEPCGKLSDLKGLPMEEEREVAVAKMFDDWCGGEEPPVLLEEECAEAFSRWFRTLTKWPPPKLAFASGWAAHQQRGVRPVCPA